MICVCVCVCVCVSDAYLFVFISETSSDHLGKGLSNILGNIFINTTCSGARKLSLPLNELFIYETYCVSLLLFTFANEFGRGYVFTTVCLCEQLTGHNNNRKVMKLLGIDHDAKI